MTTGPVPVGGGWTAATLDPGWRRPIAGDEVDALDQALFGFRAACPSLDLSTLTGANFVLPHHFDLVEQLRHRLIEGHGVAAVEGFPVDRYHEQELRAIWWGLSNALGAPVAQSYRGDMIGDVRDIGTGITGSTGRGYTSNAELNFHSDVADVSGLFFLKTAKEGGVTRIASSVMVHDRIAERRPDLLELLYQSIPCSWQGNQPVGELGWYDMPVFGRVGADTACAYVRTNLLLAHQNAGAPPLTSAQREAVQMVADVANEPDMWVEHRFDPGAMFFTNNHTTFHLRTAFVDFDEPERKRHLLRVWLSPPNSRPLPDSFAAFWGDVRAGAARGGYPSRNATPRFSTV